MGESKHTLALVVRPTSIERQFSVGCPDDSLKPRDMTWEDYYVGFSGYFGSHGPYVIAAAPQLLEALRNLRNETSGKARPSYLIKAHAQADAAIAKAEGRSQ